MDALYPNLLDRFKSEGICPICLMEMELTPRYSCINGHTMCHRCKPYYCECPTCRSPLDIVAPPARDPSIYPLPPTHFLPHSMPTYIPMPQPSAPPIHETFLDHERHAWEAPEPHNLPLLPCAYAHLGCWVKVPTNLRRLHESRCQFRPHLEDEQLSTDLSHNDNDLVDCSHRSVGCKVRMPRWRKSIHEKYCNYKSKYEAMNDVVESLHGVSITEDRFPGNPEELLECKFKRYGCKVKMPRRRKAIHEEKCNYREYEAEDEEEPSVGEEDFDPEQRVECRWAERGCRLRPKRSRKLNHEENCNYRLQECSFNVYGCDVMFEPSRRYAHEKSCPFAR